MRSLFRLLLPAVVLPALLLSAPALAQTQDNTTVATNTTDGKSVFKLSFKVKEVTGDVDATNTAAAYASCTDCRTVAIAVQVVLVSGEVGDVMAVNEADAINIGCTECETLARALQFVFGDGQELEFTKEGKAKLHDLKKQFQDLKDNENLTYAQLVAVVSDLSKAVAAVVVNETELAKKAEPTATTTTTTTVPSTTSTTAPGSSSTSIATTTSTVATTSTTVATTTTVAPTTTTTTVAP